MANFEEIMDSQLTCRFCCRRRRADNADASCRRGDAAARTTDCFDAGAAGSRPPRWMSRSHSRWSRGSTAAQDSRKDDWGTWVVAPQGRGSLSYASFRWPVRTEDR